MKLRTLIIIILVFLSVFGWWAWPKKHTLSVSRYHVGHYTGFGIAGAESPVFGKRYYLVTVTYDGFKLEVKYDRPGYNPFKRSYPDGTLAEEGECMVECYDPAEPVPDESDLLWSRCYKPDGTLGSEVKNGTGTQIYWSPEGVKIWELELVDFKKVRSSIWHPNGQLAVMQKYRDGQMDGPFVTYYASGTKRTEGSYSKGDRVGKWIRYNEDGTVSEIEDYASAVGDINRNEESDRRTR
jgi:hypothetical protein